MVKSELHSPPSQRPAESAGLQVEAKPGTSEVPLATAAGAEADVLVATPARETEPPRGRYRRVFACATAPSNTPNE